MFYYNSPPFICFFVCFCSAIDQTQDLTNARQRFYHSATSPDTTLFCFNVFTFSEKSKGKRKYSIQKKDLEEIILEELFLITYGYHPIVISKVWHIVL